MASLALGVVGAVIGNIIAPGIGGQIGFALGAYAGGYLEEGPHSEGPRLNDRAVQASTYGIPIPIIRGTARVAGNIIWAADLREVPVDEGGKGGPSATSTTYTYYGNFAISLCANPISAIRKIWADGNLIYDASDGNSGPLGISATEAFFQHINIADVALPIVLYKGTETQLPDATIEAYLGAGNVPAYRGQAYIVFTDFPLERFGNRIPNLSFEVIEVGEIADQVTVYTPIVGLRYHAVYNPLLNEVWQEIVQTTGASDPYLVRLNADTGEIVGYVYGAAIHSMWDPGNLTGGTHSFSSNPIYDADSCSVFVASDGQFARIDAATGVELLSVSASSYLGPIYLHPLTHEIWRNDIGFNFIRNINKYTGAVAYSVARSALDYMVFDLWLGKGWIIATNKLYVLDELGTAVTLAYTWSGASLDQITYDTLRNVLLITVNGSANVIQYDIITNTVGSTFTFPHIPTAIEYDPQRDLILGTNWALSTGKVFAIFAMDGSAYKDVANTDFGLHLMPGRNAILLTGGATSGLDDWDLVKIRFDVVTGGSVILSDVVEDICVRAGLETADVDVTQLTDTVLGYVMSRQSAARACIEQLATGFLFDGVESDDVIKFIKRGGASAASIPADDLAAHEASSQMPDIITKTRAQDVELPTKLNVIYSARALDYQQSTQIAERLAGAAPDSAQLMSIEAPIVMTDDYARQLADALMFNAWTERTRYAFATGVKYAHYEPTDVLTVNGNTLRIKRKQEAGGLIKFEGVAEDSSIYTQSMVGVEADFDAQTVDTLVMSYFTPMDTVLLRDADDTVGFYAVGGGYQTGWTGEVLYESDDGITYTQRRALTVAATQGVATSALGDFYGGNVFDELNTLTVALRAGSTLSSSTNLDVLNGANPAALQSADGWEILQYRDATLNANGTYTLRGLLRGRRGSEFAMSGHAAGDVFVILSGTTVVNLVHDTSDLDQARFYKPVSIGDTVASTTAQSFTDTGARLMPLAPVHVGGGRNAALDVTISWIRRSRIGGEWRDGVDVPVGEDSELYDVDIYTTSGYVTVARTVANLSSATMTYTAAQQTTDFGSTQSTVYLKVYQKSVTVGRGFAASATV